MVVERNSVSKIPFWWKSVPLISVSLCVTRPYLDQIKMAIYGKQAASPCSEANKQVSVFLSKENL